jgi:hypothetical protein
MAQQTAVEWFNQQLVDKQNGNGDSRNMDEIFEQAKEKDKQQIETAYNKGTINGIDYPESKLALTGEQYYTQTYGK